MRRDLAAAGVVGIAVLVVLSFVLGAAFGARTPTPSPTATPRRSPDRTVPVPVVPTPLPSPSPTPIDTSIVAAAHVVPLRSADLAAPIGGTVDLIFVREEQQVAADRILVQLDQSAHLAAINVAQAAVGRGEAAVERATIQLEQLPPDASPGQVDSAQAELRLAQAELAFARSTLNEAQVAIRQTELRAPFAGTIAALHADVSEQVPAGQPVVTIGDMSGWLIETTDLSELDVVRITVGDRATVTFAALPDLELGGTVSRIQVRGTTDNGGITFAVAVRPDEHNPVLRWNMTATVRIRPGP